MLEGFGVKFLRFDDLEVKKNMSNVLRTIKGWIEDNKKPTPTLATANRSKEGIEKVNDPSKEGNETVVEEKDSHQKPNASSILESNPLSGGVGVGQSKINPQHLLEIAKKAAIQGGEAIIEIYESGDFSIEAKSDNSPLTKADKAAHNAIVEILDETGLPILSEEGASIDFDVRKNWEYFWMIDPLDGTKEFIKKNGEFTVNIALINRNKPVLGVVYTPVTKDLYWGVAGKGAFRDGKKITVNTKDKSEKGLKVVASRSHMNEETESYIGQFNDPEIVSKGSSLKLLMVAEGAADVYPRYAPTMEWDTAASQIIVEEAGGQVLIKDTEMPVVYNKENLLNPYFLVKGQIS